jgi:diguanylate cyclase (GGDEF)-like protein
MLPYIKKSLDKFKQDALSKVIYDILKYVVLVTITLLIAKLIPEKTSFGTIINQKITLTVLNIGLIIILVIAVTLVVTLVYTRKKYRLLQQDNYTDELTGLLNYKALKDLLPKTIEACQKQKTRLSLLIIDIDDFKQFNERYSYQTADKVLAKVGTLLRSDSRITDTTFRQYQKGDEFIVLAKETELPNAIIAARRKKDLFKTGIEVNERTYRVTVSCGVTEFHFEEDTQDTALARLNNALKVAKSRQNKNSVEALI